VEQIKKHIHVGDIFEMNFCQEFFIENTEVNPYTLFQKLNTIAQAPFTAFYKLKDKFALCASPERYLKKEGQTLTSQPIKGTSKRGNTEGVDEALKNTLFNDPKNRSENVMIVDLVRNDLGKICEAGSIKVSELFGIYSFPTVHQMISTVTGTVRPEFDNTDVLRATFPMGSMTGAPKVRAMQLIEKYERTRRGLYSGAIGYITPESDFDFNVLIRSILYNQNNHYLSFQVGGAIVADSDAEKEYEECLVKIQGILRALS
jgi:para-aminobenzoate synthetase component I